MIHSLCFNHNEGKETPLENSYLIIHCLWEGVKKFLSSVIIVVQGIKVCNRQDYIQVLKKIFSIPHV